MTKDVDPMIEWQRIPTEDELAAMISESSREGVFFLKTPQSTDPGIPGCWLGGQPTLPDDIEWPTVWNGDGEYDEDYPEGPPPYPMHFVAQIDLAQMPDLVQGVGLPAAGTLFFFLDPFIYPSGQSGLSRVYFAPGDVSKFPPREMPEFPDMEIERHGTSYGHLSTVPRGYKRWPFETHSFVGFRHQQFKNATFDELAGNMMSDLIDEVCDAQIAKVSTEMSNPLTDPAAHHLLGEIYRPSHDERFVRLLALRDDQDIGFDFDGEWTVFYIGEKSLSACQFENVSVAREFQ